MAFKLEKAKHIDGLRTLTVGMVNERGKLRIVYALTFEGPSRYTGGKPRKSVNSDINWERVHECELSDILDVTLKCI